jgi:hypothetical protein
MTAQKSPVKSADDSLVVESPLSSVVQTYGVLKIYDNASFTSVTKMNNVDTVLKSLNVTILPNEPDEINLLNPNTIFETQVGSDTDSTVLSENTDPKLLTHDKHCTDSTDITPQHCKIFNIGHRFRICIVCGNFRICIVC